MTIEKIYTQKEVLEIIKIHPETLRKFIREKKIKAIKIGREYRIKESDLQAYLTQD